MFTAINVRYRKEDVQQYETVHRRDIIRFCRGVLTRQNDRICGIINEHDLALSPLDIARMNLTKETFGDSFRGVCEELFKMRRPRTAYIIAILAYALKLDEYHLLHSKAWYRTDLLIHSLADVLVDNGFDPDILTVPNRCTLL